ncbi:DegV family protein [Chryseomicrobium aureum]|uniref:DegV family protein n=1 Tax=Chryseomicrobium aureum TaxID=1441723 RepID=UPI00370D0806
MVTGTENKENPESEVKIHVVDSKSMSHGSGWLVMKSSELEKEGHSFEDIVTFVESHKTKVKHFLSVDDLSHLIRSGRISGASALIGKLLFRVTGTIWELLVNGDRHRE